MIKAFFFDLFFTLIYPAYSVQHDNEYDVLGISQDEWEKYAEDSVLYTERAKGKVKNGEEIIEKIVKKMPYQVTSLQKRQILINRSNRMKNALCNIDPVILDTLTALHGRGYQLGLISNADAIDCQHWKDSPLFQVFDTAVFSCDVGMLKPDVEIYKLAMEKLNVLPHECIFVGDGGSDELSGAKKAGMKTCFSEFLEQKAEERKKEILQYADFHVHDFSAIIKCVE